VADPYSQPCVFAIFGHALEAHVKVTWSVTYISDAGLYDERVANAFCQQFLVPDHEQGDGVMVFFVAHAALSYMNWFIAYIKVAAVIQ
jgi:hypothetical protein